MPTMSQAQFQLLVANFVRPYPSLIVGADPENQSYTRSRTGFLFQHIQCAGAATSLTNATGVPASSVIVSTVNARLDTAGGVTAPTADLQVVSNVFDNTSASIFVGGFELVSNRDFVVGAGVNATATNIGAAIDTLPGFSTIVAVDTVTVTGPVGQLKIRFEVAYRGGEENFSLTYPAVAGFLGVAIGTGALQPATILPAGVPNGVAP